MPVVVVVVVGSAAANSTPVVSAVDKFDRWYNTLVAYDKEMSGVRESGKQWGGGGLADRRSR